MEAPVLPSTEQQMPEHKPPVEREKVELEGAATTSVAFDERIESVTSECCLQSHKRREKSCHPEFV